MNRLMKIIQTAAPETGVQFREKAYGSEGVRRYLVDVLAMANAAVDGTRYIVTGIGFDENGQKRFRPVADRDFAGEPPYEAIVAEFIEPPINIRYRSVAAEDQCVGVYEIGNCRDKPYMMRIDYSERLRRGDAYVRVDDAAIKVGRRMLLHMFEMRPRRSVPDTAIEVGFSGDVMRKKLRVPTVDMRGLPSVVERSKLSQYIDVRKKTRNSGATTRMARLMHMRLFGSDDPYEDRSPTGLLAEMKHIDQKYEAADQLFLFEENAQKLQLVVFNQGDTPIQDASFTLMMPNHKDLHVASRLPAALDPARERNGVADFADYPAVSVTDKQIHISRTLGDVPAGFPVDVFDLPLRLCVGSELNGKRLKMRYKLYGSNLRQSIEGQLELSFHGAADD